MTVRALVVFVVAALFAVPSHAKNLKLPPVETGRIGDSPAILLWPILAGPGDPENRLLDPAGCIVRVIEASSLDKELTYKCGEWFVPPAIGKYSAWLESESWISGAPVTVRFGGGKFQGSGTRLLVPMVPAGVVKVTTASPAGAERTTVRLLSLDGLGYAFERRATPAQAAAGVRMPRGRALAGLFGEQGEALTLTRPFTVAEGAAVSVTAEAPRGGSGVLAVLRKPANEQGFSQAEATFALEDARGRRDPDVVLTAPSRIYVVWYGAQGASARLRVDSRELRLERDQLPLQPGRIATLRTELAFKQLPTRVQ